MIGSEGAEWRGEDESSGRPGDVCVPVEPAGDDVVQVRRQQRERASEGS